MDGFSDAKHRCSLMARSWVHLARSADFFQRYLDTGKDLVLRSALFSSAVTQYGIPFGPSKTRDGSSVRLRSDQFQSVPGFEGSLHAHLMLVRNKLVAHDDLGFIEARLMILSTKHTLADGEYPAIRRLSIATKVLDIPSSDAMVEKMLAHAKVCAKACQDLAFDALDAYHDIAVQDWAGYKGQALVDESFPTKDSDGESLPPPNLEEHPFMSPESPSSAEEHGGYVYSRFNLNQDREPPFPVRLKDGSMVGINAAALPKTRGA